MPLVRGICAGCATEANVFHPMLFHYETGEWRPVMDRLTQIGPFCEPCLWKKGYGRKGVYIPVAECQPLSEAIAQWQSAQAERLTVAEKAQRKELGDDLYESLLGPGPKAGSP